VISLVTPSLDDGRFIADALASVLDQGYPELEYVVMDGGSTDGSVETIGRHRGRLHHFESKPDAGHAAAINEGFTHCSGEIMAWLSADDLLLPGALAYVARYFAEHPDVDMVYGHRIILDEAGRDIGLWVTPRHRRQTLLWFDYLPQETAFWRRRLWDRAGGIDESFSVAFDWDLFLRFQEMGARIVRLDRLLGAFRVHPDQQSERHREQALMQLAAIRDRTHGRPVTLAEAKARVDAVRLRSVPLYARYRLMGWLRGRRIGRLA
jgi:glycosyltransferase involved in cell wall biosynthesis